MEFHTHTRPLSILQGQFSLVSQTILSREDRKPGAFTRGHRAISHSSSNFSTPIWIPSSVLSYYVLMTSRNQAKSPLSTILRLLLRMCVTVSHRYGLQIDKKQLRIATSADNSSVEQGSQLEFKSAVLSSTKSTSIKCRTAN